MAGNNPFIVITSTGRERIVDRLAEKAELQLHINDIIKNGGIFILQGPPGMGKSLMMNWILKDLLKKTDLIVLKDDFTPSIYNRLRSMVINPAKRTVLILDDFNNVELLDKSSQKKVIQLISEISHRLGVVLVENREEQGVDKDLKRMSKEFQKFKLAGLKPSDMKLLVVDRLNMTRPVPTEQLDPFTEDEFEKIYRKSGGNPRIALLICATLYDEKQNSLI